LYQQGSAIYAEISDDLIKEKAHLFDIGKVNVVRKFVVNNAKKATDQLIRTS